MEKKFPNNTEDKEFIGYNALIFGENLEDNRRRLGLTQYQLSELLNKNYNISLSAKMISTYECGNSKSVIGADKAIALADIFEIKVEALLGIVPNIDKNVIASGYGLTNKTAEKLEEFKRLSKKTQPLFPTDKKDIDTINNQFITNYLIGNTKVIENTTDKVKEIFIEIRKKEDIRISLEKELKDTQEKLKNEIDNEKAIIWKNKIKEIKKRIIEFNKELEKFTKYQEFELNQYFNEQLERLLKILQKEITL